MWLCCNHCSHRRSRSRSGSRSRNRRERTSRSRDRSRRSTSRDRRHRSRSKSRDRGKHRSRSHSRERWRQDRRRHNSSDDDKRHVKEPVKELPSEPVVGHVCHSAYTHTHTHTHLTALCPGLPRWASTRKVKPIWILLTQETVSGSGISCAICKSG